MAQIRIDLAETLVDGMDIKFKAPCACNEITGLVVRYPAEDETTKTKEFVFRDAHGNDLTGMGNLFSKDAYVKIIVDTEHGYAYPQNADTNGYLNTAILGTYTHDAENLIGRGENGKFKATVTGTISTINVNGVSCSVKCGEDSTMDLIAGCWYTFILDGNTVNFSSGGAGGGLNFKVVGGTTKPVSPKENMIWVNTSADITTYLFSSTEPSDPTPGMVWIQTGINSGVQFNALKKNGIMIYPLSAKQYTNGVWVDKTAKTYKGGGWVDWIVWLYRDGVFSSSVDCTEKKTPTSASIVYNDTDIHLSTVAGKTSEVYIVVGPMDLSAMSKLILEGTFVNRTHSTYANVATVFVSELANASYKNAAAITSLVTKDTLDAGYQYTIELDTSSLSGNYYIYAGVNTQGDDWATKRENTITSLRGEP